MRQLRHDVSYKCMSYFYLEYIDLPYTKVCNDSYFIEYYNSYGLSKIVNITILYLALDTFLTPEISKYGCRPFTC